MTLWVHVFLSHTIPLLLQSFSLAFCLPLPSSFFFSSFEPTRFFSEVDSISLPSRSEILCPFLPHLTYHGQSKLQSFLLVPFREKGTVEKYKKDERKVFGILRKWNCQDKRLCVMELNPHTRSMCTWTQMYLPVAPFFLIYFLVYFQLTYYQYRSDIGIASSGFPIPDFSGPEEIFPKSGNFKSRSGNREMDFLCYFINKMLQFSRLS